MKRANIPSASNKSPQKLQKMTQTLNINNWAENPRAFVDRYSCENFGRFPSESISQITITPIVFEYRLTIDAVDGLSASALGASKSEAETYAAIQLCRLIQQSCSTPQTTPQSASPVKSKQYSTIDDEDGKITSNLDEYLSESNEQDAIHSWFKTPRDSLYVYAIKHYKLAPTYEVSKTEKGFLAVVTIDTSKGLVGKGKGITKKLAQKLAAYDLLKRIDNVAQTFNSLDINTSKKSSPKTAISPITSALKEESTVKSDINKKPSTQQSPLNVAAKPFEMPELSTQSLSTNQPTVSPSLHTKQQNIYSEYLAADLQEYKGFSWYKNARSEVQKIFAHANHGLPKFLTTYPQDCPKLILTTVSMSNDNGLAIIGRGQSDSVKESARLASIDFCVKYYREYGGIAKDPKPNVSKAQNKCSVNSNTQESIKGTDSENSTKQVIPRKYLDKVPKKYEAMLPFIRDKVEIIFSFHKKTPTYLTNGNNDTGFETILCFTPSLVGRGRHPKSSKMSSSLAAIDFMMQYAPIYGLKDESALSLTALPNSPTNQPTVTTFNIVQDTPSSTLKSSSNALSSHPRESPSNISEIPVSSSLSSVNTISEPVKSLDEASKYIRYLFQYFGKGEPIIQINRSGPAHSPIWKASLELEHGNYLLDAGFEDKSKSNAIRSVIEKLFYDARTIDPGLYEAYYIANKPPKVLTREEATCINIELHQKARELLRSYTRTFSGLSKQAVVCIRDLISQHEDEVCKRDIEMEDDFSSINLTLKQELETFLDSSHGKSIINSIERFEIYQHKESISLACHSSQVVVIGAPAGSGKSTLIPSFILNDAIMSGSGAKCSILVSEPRKIAAISLSQYVAYLRGDIANGKSKHVGYQVRFDSNLPCAQGNITYCTTGILLNQLCFDPLLKSISHIIVDEVHERDLMTDFCLLLLRNLLGKRPDLKLLLMTATTLSLDSFMEYFMDYKPVKIILSDKKSNSSLLFLDDFLDQCDNTLLSADDTRAFLDAEYKLTSFSNVPSLNQFYTVDTDLEDGEHTPPIVENGISNPIDDVPLIELCASPIVPVPYSLLEAVVGHIVLKTPPEDAILVFLPGWEEIGNLYETLIKEDVLQIGYSNQERFQIHKLHSQVQPMDQQAVFASPLAGVRKIILSTNIAETSITIEDVVHVVDLGKVKIPSFDQETRLRDISSQWCSQSSIMQRAGRAGRIPGKPGTYWCLMSRQRYHQLPIHHIPEILRADLQQMCLQIKALGLVGTIESVFLQAMDTPNISSARKAIEHLQEIEALDKEEQLTGLGKLLFKLPLPPATGKMLLYGQLFGCLDPILTIAAAMSIGGPFLSPKYTKGNNGQSNAFNDYRAIFGSKAFQSDHVAISEAYVAWKRARIRFFSRADELQFCSDHGLSLPALHRISQARQQLIDVLDELDLFNSVSMIVQRSKFLEESSVTGFEALFNTNIARPSIIAAITLVGLYPQLAVNHTKNHRHLITRSDDFVLIHPSGINYMSNNWHKCIPETSIFVYQDKIRTSNVFLLSLSLIHSLDLAIFSRIDPIKPDLIAGWIKFDSRCSMDVALIQDFKTVFNRILGWFFVKCTTPNSFLEQHSNSPQSPPPQQQPSPKRPTNDTPSFERYFSSTTNTIIRPSVEELGFQHSLLDAINAGIRIITQLLVDKV